MTRGRRVGLAAAIALALFVAYEVISSFVAFTDDAYVQSDLVALAPQVTGRIIAVHVADNQDVAEGDLLASIDPVPFQLASGSAACRSCRRPARRSPPTSTGSPRHGTRWRRRARPRILRAKTKTPDDARLGPGCLPRRARPGERYAATRECGTRRRTGVGRGDGGHAIHASGEPRPRQFGTGAAQSGSSPAPSWSHQPAARSRRSACAWATLHRPMCR